MRAAFVSSIALLLALVAWTACGPALAQGRRAAAGVQPLGIEFFPKSAAPIRANSTMPMPPSPGPDGSQHYHLKWMTPDGRIEWLDTDARTGRVLNSSPGRDSFDAPGTARDYPPAPSYPAPGYGGRFRGGENGGRWQGGDYPRGGGPAYGNERYEGRPSGGRRRDR